MIRLQQAVNDMKFLSTLSLRRATFLFFSLVFGPIYFYPRSPCGERRVVHVAQDPSPGRISIHALLAESDPAGNGGSGSITAISIHALLAESDTKDKKYKIKKAIFLSTLSLRRATGAGTVVLLVLDNFYPRSPCGERRVSVGRHSPSFYFYPRSPCGERPPIWGAAPAPATHFYPRSPCGERLVWVVPHACKQNFYPRSPCGERLRGSAPRPAPR